MLYNFDSQLLYTKLVTFYCLCMYVTFFDIGFLNFELPVIVLNKTTDSP